jgi:hypothetical protein
LGRAINQLLDEPELTHSKAHHAQEIAREQSFDFHMDRFDRALGELGLL